MHLGFESVAKHTLLIQRPDHSLYRSVVLWAAGREEFLLLSKTFDRRCAAPAAEDQTIAWLQQARCLNFSKSAIAVN